MKGFECSRTGWANLRRWCPRSRARLPSPDGRRSRHRAVSCLDSEPHRRHRDTPGAGRARAAPRGLSGARPRAKPPRASVASAGGPAHSRDIRGAAAGRPAIADDGALLERRPSADKCGECRFLHRRPTSPVLASSLACRFELCEAESCRRRLRKPQLQRPRNCSTASSNSLTEPRSCAGPRAPHVE